MTRFAFAWELGANYGHLARDIPVALKLRANGHKVLFFVSDVRMAAELLERHRLPYLQAPLWLHPQKLKAPPANYAELLLAEGWGDQLSLLGAVRSWLSAFTLARTEVVVADHAPTALLAAHIGGLNRVAFGSGFEIPPARTPFPSIRPWEQIPQERLTKSDAHVLAAANKVCSYHSGAPLDSLSAIFPAKPLLATFPELDPFGKRDAAIYLGSIHGLDSAKKVAWPLGEGEKVLLYLRPQQGCCLPALSALADTGSVAICSVPGLDEEQRHRHESSSITVHSRPVAFESLLGEATAMVCHGGAGTIAQSLLAGVPLLIIPATVEQYLNAKRVEALGAGIVLDPAADQAAIVNGLQKLFEAAAYRKAALCFSDQYENHESEVAISKAAEEIIPASAERRQQHAA